MPISFVVVRFSDEYLHNFLKSECAHDSLNEVIEVDNTSNLHFDNLSQAILAGLDRAQNDIIVVVHEDVLLPQGWQPHFERSLRQLEAHDASWGVLGSVGWDAGGAFAGHWSDPHQFKNTFGDSGYKFQEVEKLDEQLLIFHRRRLPRLDANLPGIHFLGEDLKQVLSRSGLRCYAIDAPTIHKYADKKGERILSSTQSDKISDRENVTYLADEACCKDYLSWKYPHLFPAADAITASVQLGANISANKSLQVTRPVIFICKGELESAVIGKIAQDSGVFFGDESGEAGSAPALMMPVCKMIIEKYRCHAQWQKHHTLDTLRLSAARIIAGLPASASWGIALPECILVLPELSRAFPNARYVYFQRDPLDICMGKPQRTARLDNHVGRIALPEAYDFLGIERTRILADSEMDHRVHTTIHQLGLVKQHLVNTAESEPLILRFEDFMENPASTIERLCHWLGDPTYRETAQAANIEVPSSIRSDGYSPAIISAAAEKLTGLRKALGYI